MTAEEIHRLAGRRGEVVLHDVVGHQAGSSQTEQDEERSHRDHLPFPGLAQPVPIDAHRKDKGTGRSAPAFAAPDRSARYVERLYPRNVPPPLPK